MKKYFIASVVAVMAFAFAAFAASLTVTSSVVQAGETDSGFTCVEEAEVVGWGYGETTGDVTSVDVKIFNPGGAAHTCDGETLYVTLLGSEGTNVSGSVELELSEDTYKVLLDDVAGASNVESVRIGIVQEYAAPE